MLICYPGGGGGGGGLLLVRETGILHFMARAIARIGHRLTQPTKVN